MQSSLQLENLLGEDNDGGLAGQVDRQLSMIKGLEKMKKLDRECIFPYNNTEICFTRKYYRKCFKKSILYQCLKVF